MTGGDPGAIRAEAYRLYQAGNIAAAERISQTLAQSFPNDWEVIYLLGACAHAAGRLEEAVARYARADQLAPNNARLINAQGEAYLALGRLDEALASFRQARALLPTYERVHNNLGRLHHLKNNLSESRASFEAALRLNPRYATAHNNLGAVLQAQGEVDSAVQCYRQAIALDPNYPEAQFNLGCQLQAAGDPEGASRQFQTAIRLRPSYVRAFFHMGQVLALLRRDYDALTCFREAVRLQPNDVEMQVRLGDHLILKKDWTEAIETLERACALQPDQPEPFARLAQARQLVCDWRTYAADLDRLWADAEKQIAASLATSTVPFQALTTPWPLPRLLAVARSHSDAIARHQRKRPVSLTHPPRSAAARLRIGYLSGDFSDHPISHLLHGLFERHDRAGFEIFAYSFGPPDDSAYRRRAIAGCDRFIEVGTLSIPDLARRVAADGIHILVDLMGHTGVNRLGALALRPAPIQVSLIGMLGTMGADFIDYLIGDSIVTPPEFAPFFVEKFVTMPDSYLIAEPEPILPDGNARPADLGLPENAFVYCSFNNTYKLEPTIFDVWMNILRQVPGSVLWLFSSGPIADENLRREARARDVDPERLIFARFVPRPEHIRRHRAADLFLDTQIYNAAATSSLALQAGLPVLTCLGETFASRVGASVLRAAELPELIAANLDDYVHRAVDLARRPDELGRLRDKLVASRSRAPLFDTARYVRNLERAYRSMWDAHAAGRSPQPFDVVEPPREDH